MSVNINAAFNITITLQLCSCLLMCSIFIHSLELLRSPILWSQNGAFRQGLSEKSFKILLHLRVFLSVMNAFAVFFFPVRVLTIFFVLLWLSQWFLYYKFQGPANGGSDSMQNLILTSLTITWPALVFFNPNLICIYAIYFIAIQCLYSYFVAGFVKIKKPEWRSGAALHQFLLTTIYRNSPKDSCLEKCCNNKFLLLISSWLLLLSELGLPILLWTQPQLTMPLLLLGVGFHLFNAYWFGLNRFVYAWLACYPCVLYASVNHN